MLLPTVTRLGRLVAARHRDGRAFFVSANGVWPTDAVPPSRLGVI